MRNAVFRLADCATIFIAAAILIFVAVASIATLVVLVSGNIH